MNSAYFWLAAIFPEVSISYMVWSRHFTSSVGQRTSAAKAEAKEPAAAFWRSLKRQRRLTTISIPSLQHTRESTRMPEGNLLVLSLLRIPRP